jgi:anti-anti-sigma regulatory factor
MEKGLPGSDSPQPQGLSASSRIRVEIRDAVEGETLTLSLEGELDLESVPVIRQQLDTQISGGKR